VRPITARQAEILRWIAHFVEQHGYPPTNREIGSAFGIRSTNAVDDVLHALERKGFIQRTRMISRGIRVLREEVA
jgi:repressor LexA